MFKSTWAKILAIILGAGTIGTIIIKTTDNNNTTTTDSTGVITTDTTKRVDTSQTHYLQLLGYNGQINFNAVTYVDTNFLNAIAQTNAEIIRAPGGTFAREFNWRKDVPSVQDLQALKKKLPRLRINLVLNMVTQSLEANLQWIDTLVKLKVIDSSLIIEGSNESNMASSPEITKYGGIEQYLRECKTWFDAIRAKYPAARFGVPAGNKGGKYFSHWNDYVNQYVPEAFLIWHYHNPRFYAPNGYVDTALVSHLIDSCYKAEFPGISTRRVWITEFNLRSEGEYHDISFANEEQQGLAASFMMRKFYIMGFGIIEFHNLCQAQENGAIQSTKKESHLISTGEQLSILIKQLKNG